MKFNGKNLPKTRNDLDEFVREWDAIPYGMLTYKGRDIFIAESDHKHDSPVEYPWGYYYVFWFTSRPDNNEKLDLGSWIEFEAMHDSNMTKEGRREARVNTAIVEAKKWIDKNIAVGRMDA